MDNTHYNIIFLFDNDFFNSSKKLTQSSTSDGNLSPCVFTQLTSKFT